MFGGLPLQLLAQIVAWALHGMHSNAAACARRSAEGCVGCVQHLNKWFACTQSTLPGAIALTPSAPEFDQKHLATNTARSYATHHLTDPAMQARPDKTLPSQWLASDVAKRPKLAQQAAIALGLIMQPKAQPNSQHLRGACFYLLGAMRPVVSTCLGLAFRPHLFWVGLSTPPVWNCLVWGWPLVLHSLLLLLPRQLPLLMSFLLCSGSNSHAVAMQQEGADHDALRQCFSCGTRLLPTPPVLA